MHRTGYSTPHYTNADAATLTLNGVEIGTRAAEGRIVRWRVQLRPGLNRIEVHTHEGLRDAVEWSYLPSPAMISPVE